MKRGWISLATVAAAISSAAPAAAEEPYYFHKASVSREAYIDDVEYCAGLAGGVIKPDYRYRVYSPDITATVIGSAIGAIFSTMLERKVQRRLVSRVERTCMGDRGYGRRSLDKDGQRAIHDLEGQAKLDRMFALVSAEQPIGKVLVE